LEAIPVNRESGRGYISEKERERLVLVDAGLELLLLELLFLS